jgi:uncharacterized protein (DUF305 family)
MVLRSVIQKSMMSDTGFIVVPVPEPVVATMGTGMSGGNNMSGMSDVRGMAALQNATGAEFDRMWVSQMLTMHNAKVTELQAASTQITDPDLKAIVTKALPIVRNHRDRLVALNTGSGNNANSRQ